MSVRAPRRLRLNIDKEVFSPVHVVWEITLACNLRCQHCGSRAGRPRQNELSTDEALDVVTNLDRHGVREISLIGGEAYLRRDWLVLIRAIAERGIHCSLQTGGRALTESKINDAAHAGLQSAGVSIDGMEASHDKQRGVAGSYAQALNALIHLHKAGIKTSVNTQVNTASLSDLPKLLPVLSERGVRTWQLQLTVAMGNAADNDDLLIQPHQIPEVLEEIFSIYRKAAGLGIRVVPGNNIGYFGPYEQVWRGINNDESYWTGCSAGQTTLGIEADGTVKGCPSLPTNTYIAGNVRDPRFWESVQRGKTREIVLERRAELWGFCASCYYSAVCEGGCTWTSHVLFGKPGNNPFCHYRARSLRNQGLRERIEKVAEAPGQAFDHGEFRIVLETENGTPSDSSALDPLERSAAQAEKSLIPCKECGEFIFKDESVCPQCGIDVTNEFHSRVDVRTVTANVRRLLAEIETRQNFVSQTILK